MTSPTALPVAPAPPESDARGAAGISGEPQATGDGGAGRAPGDARRWRFAVLALFGAALALRLALLPTPGNSSDISGLIRFGAQVAAAGPHALYDPPDLANNESHFTYVPLFPYLLAGTFWTWTLLGRPGAPELAPGPEPPYPVAALMVKLWAVAGDLAIGALILSWVHRFVGRRWALGAAAAFLFSPGVVYDSAWWGQIDSLFTVGVLMALLAPAGRFPGASLPLHAAAVLTKPQALVAGPLVALVALLRGGTGAVLRGGVAALLLCAVVALPFLLTGRLDRFAGAYLRATEAYPRVSVNAYNAWYLAGEALASREDSAPFAAGLSFRQAGLLGLLPVLVLAVWHLRPFDRRLWRRAPPATLAPAWILGAAVTYVAFFMFPTQIHERYLYPALPLLCLVLHRHPAVILAYGLLSVAFFVNLARVVPWTPEVPAWLAGAGWTPECVAAFNLAALALLLPLLMLRPVWPRSGASWTLARRAAGLALPATVILTNLAVQAHWSSSTAADVLWLFLFCLTVAAGGLSLAPRLRRFAPQRQSAPRAPGLSSRR